VPFLSYQKIGGQLGPLPRHFSPNSPDQKSEIAILFNIVERPNNNVFGDNMKPQSSWEKVFKLKNVTIVYI